jgi:hypothetical protein
MEPAAILHATIAAIVAEIREEQGIEKCAWCYDTCTGASRSSDHYNLVQGWWIGAAPRQKALRPDENGVACIPVCDICCDVHKLRSHGFDTEMVLLGRRFCMDTVLDEYVKS